MSKDITELREQIDEIDAELFLLLVKRFSLMPDVIAYKKSKGLPILDRERELAVIAEKKKLAVEAGIDEKFAEDLFELIMSESRRLQADTTKEQ